MSGRARITEWHGPALKKRIHAAEVQAVDRVTEDTAATVARSHSWSNRTGRLQASIDAHPAARTADGAAGAVGYGEPYGLFLEIGMRGRPGSHDIRRAADRSFPTLPEAIRREAGL